MEKEYVIQFKGLDGATIVTYEKKDNSLGKLKSEIADKLKNAGSDWVSFEGKDVEFIINRNNLSAIVVKEKKKAKAVPKPF